MKVKKGYFLIDVLFSISIIVILASFIIPSIMNNICISNREIKRNERIKNLQSDMESVIGSKYKDKNFNIKKSGVDVQNINDDLVLVEVKGEDKNDNISFKVYLKKEGIYPNWACDFHSNSFLNIFTYQLFVFWNLEFNEN